MLKTTRTAMQRSSKETQSSFQKWYIINFISEVSFQLRSLNYKVYFPYRNLSPHRPYQELTDIINLNHIIFVLRGHIVPPCHVFAYLRANTHTSAFKKTLSFKLWIWKRLQGVPKNVLIEQNHNQNWVLWADMEFVKNFTQPDFQAKNTPQKCLICDIFLVN